MKRSIKTQTELHGEHHQYTAQAEERMSRTYDEVIQALYSDNSQGRTKQSLQKTNG